MKRKDQLDLFSNVPIDYRKPINPARTAMHRKTPSPIARALLETHFFENHRVQRVLDYGCGIGRDVEFYRQLGLDAAGYDPHEAFKWTEQPKGGYDLVTNLFVFNVISNHDERRKLAATLTNLTQLGGQIIVSARSSEAIEAEARKKDWTPFGDGYLSSPARGTFQKGMSECELFSYFNSKALQTIALDFAVSKDVACIAMNKRAD